MNLEIHKPELAQRVRADDLLEKALDALDEQSTPPRRLRQRVRYC
jgi:hypothetical protein